MTSLNFRQNDQYFLICASSVHVLPLVFSSPKCLPADFPSPLSALKQQPDCPYCHDIDQTPLHLFVECPIAKSSWNKFTKWYNATCRGNIALEQNEIIYGVLKFTSSDLTLNHLIIIGKYFLYTNAVQDDKRPQFTDFVTLVNEKIELEKYIAITTNKLLSFNKKWSNFLSN